MNREQIVNDLRNIICYEIGIDDYGIDDYITLHMLGADSCNVMAIIVEVESLYDIDLNADTFTSNETFEDLVNYIEELL